MKRLTISFLLVVCYLLTGCQHVQENQPPAPTPDETQLVRQESFNMNEQLRLIMKELEAEDFQCHTTRLALCGRQYLFVTIDRGSGAYLIQGFLYEALADGPKLRHRIDIDPDRIMLRVRMKGDRVEFYEMKSLGEEVVIGSFVPGGIPD